MKLKGVLKMEKNNKDLFERELTDNETDKLKENPSEILDEEMNPQEPASESIESEENESDPMINETPEEASEENSEETASESKLPSYICTVCEYIYDPVVGDPDNGVPAGTAFEDIPDDWVCPVCGVEKDMFEIHE